MPMNRMPKVGIRPTIDRRLNVVCKTLEEQALNLAKAAAKLIAENLRYPDSKHPNRIILAVVIVVAVLCLAATSFPPNEQQLEFLKDTIQKTVTFIAIALLAVFLNLLVDWMAGIQTSPAIIFGIKVLEYLIFAIDMVWFGLYLLVTARQMIIAVLAGAYIP
jgi:hypothetical protein